MARFIIKDEVTNSSDKENELTSSEKCWKLYFQKGKYIYDNGESEEGYRFIWRRPDGSLQAARGQARIPSKKDLFELLELALKKGLLVIALVALLSIGLNAQSVSVWDGTSEIWTKGSGTESDPYLIENAQMLAFMAEMVNGGVTHYNNTYFKLTTNVYNDDLIWNPIGSDETHYFGGYFDGDNHSVTLNSPSGWYKGIFGYAKGGSLMNLTSAGFRSRSSYVSDGFCYIGGICGYTTSTIANCHNTCDMSCDGNNYVGGICGYASVAITNCDNNGKIYSNVKSVTNYSNLSCTAYVGGICGYSSSVVNNCYNTGDLSYFISIQEHYSTSTSECNLYLGGICGYTSYVISNCYNASNISDTSYSSSACRSYGYSGGICGFSSQAIVTHCYNVGDVSSVNTSSTSNGGNTLRTFSGGISGFTSSISSTSIIAYCYNTGNVTSYCKSSTNNYAGGLLGYGDLTSINITNCYNVGNISGYPYHSGGISGYSCKVANCYYLNTCGYFPGTTTGGTAKTEAQMKSPSFPIILNTDSVVFVMDGTPNINGGYPIFGSVTTLAANNIGTTTATLNGNYHMLYNVDNHGFEYKKSAESDYIVVPTTGESPVSYALSGLQGGTSYTYRFFVQKDGITYRGTDKTFNTVECLLSANITANATSLCAGDTLTYTVNATSSSSDFQYEWNTGEKTKAIRIVDDQTYSVTVTDGYGCSVTVDKQMTMYPAAVASISGNTILCENSSTTLTANGGTYYTWNTGAGARSITVNTPGIYIATVRTVYGCVASDTVEVKTFVTPTISGKLAICAGDSTLLTAAGGDSYSWSTGETSVSINVGAAGTYTVTAYANVGCSATQSVKVIQHPAFDVNISGIPVLCSGVAAELTATEGVSYLWSNGSTDRTINVNKPGTYSVTVTNENSCSNNAVVEVTSMDDIVISGDNRICSGKSTILSVDVDGDYLWSTGEKTSFIRVSEQGTYSVTVSLSNGCTASASTFVSQASSPNVSIVGQTEFCEGKNSTLTATGGVDYRWNTGASQNSISVDKSGVYTVTVTNAEGCSATTSTSVTVNPLPIVSIVGTTSFCQGDNTILTATGALTYRWNNGVNTASLEVTKAGNYRVVGTDMNGCSQSASVVVSVNPVYNYNPPINKSICQGETYPFFNQNLSESGVYTETLKTVNGCDSVITLILSVNLPPVVTVTGKTTFCEGETSMLVASGGVGYKWSTGSSQNSISVDKSGVYTVTVTNAEGCTASQEVPVTVNPLPNVTITGKQVVCEGNSTVLTANGADSYKWSTGDNTPQITISEFGKYSVVGTDVNGCSNEANVTVLVSPLPEIAILGETDICTGESTVLTATGGSSYLWSNGSSEESIEVSKAGTYQVIGYNEAGCEAKASVTIQIWQPTASEFSVTTADSCYKWNDSTYCKSGDYVQTLKTVHGCDSVVTLHLTITVGIDGFTMNKAMEIYPNPTTGIITIEGVKVDRIQLFDIYGKLLKTNVVNNDEHQIDISDCASGVYLIKAFNNDSVVGVKKIIKQ